MQWIAVVYGTLYNLLKYTQSTCEHFSYNSKKLFSNQIDLIWIQFSTIFFCFVTNEYMEFVKTWPKLSDLICFSDMKKRRNLADKETWAAEKTYSKDKNIFKDELW